MRTPLPTRWIASAIVVLAAAVAAPAFAAPGAGRPNIVLMFPDNLGWGEVGAYGSVRGVPTPNIDSIAAGGIRLDNFNVEFSCTVSRAALLTGRYAIRSAATQASGITQWEITIAEVLRTAGYATALFGKWHLGGSDWIAGRTPIDQGFDEWYGIPNSSNEAQITTMPGYDPAKTPPPHIWEQKAGGPATRVKIFDLATRRTLDREAAHKSIDFMARSAKAGKPFFLFYPLTQVHFPTLPHPDFAGKTGAGDIGDAMADVDYNVGLVLGGLHKLGLDDSTMVLWCTDNGAEGRRPWRGSSGPWRGSYNTVMEGGIRTPCVIRWPGHIAPGRTSNELVHEMDLFATFAAAAGIARLPADRAMDSVNMLPFLEGKQTKSGRESALFFTGKQIRAVKWREWKLHYAFMPEPRVTEPPLMRLFNLRSDPREETDIKDANPWASAVFERLVAEYAQGVERFPNVPPNTKDPYTP
jgi:arylsulfatase A-like enzyme